MTLPHLLLSAVLRRCCCRALSIDMFCAYGAQQQTHRTPLLRLTDGTD